MDPISSQLCRRCGMGFALAAPGPDAEITRCVVAGCGRRFWHRDGQSDERVPDRAGPPRHVTVGIDPAWRMAARAAR